MDEFEVQFWYLEVQKNDDLVSEPGKARFGHGGGRPQVHVQRRFKKMGNVVSCVYICFFGTTVDWNFTFRKAKCLSSYDLESY